MTANIAYLPQGLPVRQAGMQEWEIEHSRGGFISHPCIPACRSASEAAAPACPTTSLGSKAGSMPAPLHRARPRMLLLGKQPLLPHQLQAAPVSFAAPALQ